MSPWEQPEADPSSLPRLLREQWVRAKYERQEFILLEKQEPYSAGEPGVLSPPLAESPSLSAWEAGL